MKKLLTLTALGEAALGLVLPMYPPVVLRLLFNAELAGTGLVMGRGAGIALIALGVACQPVSGAAQVFWVMLTYIVLLMLYLAYLGSGLMSSGGGYTAKPCDALKWPLSKAPARLDASTAADCAYHST